MLHVFHITRRNTDATIISLANGFILESLSSIHTPHGQERLSEPCRPAFVFPVALALLETFLVPAGADGRESFGVAMTWSRRPQATGSPKTKRIATKRKCRNGSANNRRAQSIPDKLSIPSHSRKRGGGLIWIRELLRACCHRQHWGLVAPTEVRCLHAKVPGIEIRPTR
jgi:hypothetical protein